MTRSSRIEHSVFGSDFMARCVELKWGWKRASCEFWHRGMNDTYRIEKKGARAFLNIYRRGWRPRAEIQGEIDLLRFLGRRNISVSHPIRNKLGDFIEHVDAPEGRRYAVLFSEARGIQPESDVGNCRDYGRIVGAFHEAADSCPGSVRRPQLGIEHLAREPLKRIHPYLARHPRDLAYLTGVVEELADAIGSLLPASAPAFGICHGDLTFGNLRRDDRGRFTLFDFDCSGYGWRSYDVAIFLWSRGFVFSRSANATRMRKWNAFLDGYHAVRRLSNTELQAVYMFVPLRHIWQLGVHARLSAAFGRRAMSETNFEMHLEFIKTWLKLYKPL